MSNKKKVAVSITFTLVFAALLICGKLFFRSGGGGDEAAVYVDIAENYTPFGAMSGAGNYYTGTVSTQETWSVNLDSEAKVKELLVAVGDEVTEGQDLFIYDTETAKSELEQLEIDLVRLNNEQTNLSDSITKLETEKSRTWDSADRADYDLRIQETTLELEEKKLDIEAKENEIARKKESIENAVVHSKIAGVVSRINDPESTSSGAFGDDSSNAYITVVKTGDLQIKGYASELNVWDLSEGQEVIISSRVDDSTWHGTISKIEYNDPSSSENSNGESSSKYPFYVALDSADGLMLGQHVYVTKDMGQDDPKLKEGVWIYQYMVDETTDPEQPFVWVSQDSRLVRRPVSIGSRDDALGLIQILEGLSIEEYIAQPAEGLAEGMKTVTMGEMISGQGNALPASDDAGEIMEEEGSMDEGNYEEDIDMTGDEGLEETDIEVEEFEEEGLSGGIVNNVAKGG